MALIIQSFSDFYNFLSNSRDPRTKHLLFVSPIHLVLLETFYLVFTLRVGPWLMKNRPPYNLLYVIRINNALQVALNLYACYGAYLTLVVNDFDFRCQPVDFSNSKPALTVVSFTWWFYFSRIMDLFDTVFFVLRKKESHLSFLHIYHHSLIILACVVALNYQAGGNMVIAGALNCFVHTFMYGYYFLTSLGPEYQRYLWWKKHLTQLQIIQFVIISVHALQALFRDCAYPKGFTLVVLLQGLFFLYLFVMFYLHNYLSPKFRNKND